MTTDEIVEALRASGIRPSAHRVAIAAYVLPRTDHPSADQIWTGVRKSFPQVSRATVYNTLRSFVDKGLLREVSAEGRDVVYFDPKTEPHHHFIDEATGRIYDIPWDALTVQDVEALKGFDVREFRVVLRGRKKQ